MSDAHSLAEKKLSKRITLRPSQCSVFARAVGGRVGGSGGASVTGTASDIV